MAKGNGRSTSSSTMQEQEQRGNSNMGNISPPSQDAAMQSTTVPPPIAKEAPPASWHTTSSAESTSMAEAIRDTKPPSTTASFGLPLPARSGAGGPSKPSATCPRDSVSTGTPPTDATMNGGKPRQKRARGTPSSSSQQSSSTPHAAEAEEAGASASCPADHGSMDQDDERQLLEGCSFARRKAMTRYRHHESGSSSAIFSGEESGMNTPMPASSANGGTANGSPTGEGEEGEGVEMVKAKGKEISPPTFGEPGFGGLSLKEGDVFVSGGEPMRQRHSLPSYFSGSLTPEQQARARQQVRADLAGIDHRALKGPLRDLMSNPNYAGEVPGSLYTANGNKSSSSETEGSGSGPASLRPPIGPRRRSSSLTLPSPSPQWDTRNSSAGAIQAAMNQSFLQHQQQQQLQQQQQQGKMPPPSVNAAASKSAKGKLQPAAHRRTLRRDGSGLTVSPQEAFLDYPNVEAAISSGSAAGSGMGGGVHSVFAPDPPGLGEALAGDGLKSTPMPFSMEKSSTPVVTASEDGSSFATGAALSNNKASRSSGGGLRDDTPSLTGGSSTSSREDSTVPSPSTGAGLPIPPSSAQVPIKTGSSNRSGEGSFRGLAPSFSGEMRSYGSGLSLLKAESTTSTPDEDDDDERPFPSTKSQPYRFSNVSASSSEEEATRQQAQAKGLVPPGRRPLAGRRTPGSFGGYGYFPGSADSGMSYQEEEAPTPMTETTEEGEQDRPLAFHGVTSREDVKEEAESNDEGSDSPSIRSSAQAVKMRQSTPAGHSPPPGRAKPTPAKRTSAGISDGSEEVEEEGDEGDSDYGNTSARSKRRRARLASNSERRQFKAAPVSTTTTERTFPTNRSGMSICDYVSPLTGDYCGTEFHRLYDLTRHRETIHAKDEAKAIREKKLTLDQCVVLGKEVDPKTSSATVEWKCEGRNGCGSVFSRKDALLRHKRIRNH